MGSNCSCFYGANIDEKQFSELALESKEIKNNFSHPKQEATNTIPDLKIDASQLIKLQSFLKGYIDRYQLKNINTISKPSNQFRKSVHELPENEVPDYSNGASLKIISNLGPLASESDSNPSLISKGPVLMENKAVYIGQWNLNYMREGVGTQYWNDGTVYEGNWKNDKANGKGRMVHPNGDVYEGYWENDRACGKGTFIHNYGSTDIYAGVKYEGTWKNDKQNGEGFEIWPNGDRYQGQYENGLKHGFGKFQWADGNAYEGEFFKNFIHGFGTYKWSDGRVYTGAWKDNKMHGSGTFTWPDGRRYEGSYFNDKKHGYGVFVWKDNRKYEGNWRLGKQHGEGIYTSSSGISKSGTWHKGNKVHKSLII